MDAGLFAGRYRLGELLGSGGFASVFAATDTETGAELAIKILHPHLSASVSARALLFAEAGMTRRLGHPNIVAVLDAGTHDVGEGELAWMTMERIDGVTLHELVAARGALAPVDALALARGVLDALEAAHTAGLVHGDLSPANIMLVRAADGGIDAADVRVLDFGMAGAEGLGSVDYLAPEQARGGAIDARSDLYQLGAVLHFALTASAPFPRTSTEAVIAALLGAPPPVPSARHPGIPRTLDRIVVRAMLKHPADRFGSAAEMLESVREAEAGLDGGVAEPGRTTVLGPAARTVRLPAAAASHVAAAARVPRRRRLAPRLGSAWLAGLVVTSLVASAWTLAATQPIDSSAQPPSSPAPSATESPSPSPTRRPAPAPPAAQTAVPAVTSMPRATALAALLAAGFTIGTVTEADGAHAADTVVSVAPPPGTSLPAGSAIGVTVASGWNAVPPVNGVMDAAARQAIADAGFRVTVRERADPLTERGVVLDSEPAGGARAPVGSEVTLVVAAGPAPSPSPSLSPSPSASPSPTAPPPTPSPSAEPPSTAP